VNVPGSISESGKRERHFHPTRDKAKEHAAKLREQFLEHGSAAGAIRPSMAEDATRAAKILQPFGLSLTDAARRVALEFEKLAASKCIEEAKEQWMASMDGLRARSIKSYEVTARRMIQALSGRLLATISSEEIEESIRGEGTAIATYALHRRNARAFWNWCAKRGWCDKEVFERVALPRRAPDKEIEFLTPEAVKALLETAEETFPRAVSRYALALFAGIRAEELQRLQSNHVSKDGIDLPAEVTKKGRRRHITLSTTLRTWLKAYPFDPIPNWQNIDCAIRRLAGWDVAASLLECPPIPTRGRWPQNALRHTHASYAIAAGASLESLLFEFGHSGGGEVLRKHYLGRATKSQSEEFFSIRPRLAISVSVCASDSKEGIGDKN
jgi:integrase